MNSLQGSELKNEIDDFYKKITDLPFNAKISADIGDLKIWAYSDEELENIYKIYVKTSSDDKWVLDTGDIHSDMLYEVLYDIAKSGLDISELQKTLAAPYIADYNEKYIKSALDMSK